MWWLSLLVAEAAPTIVAIDHGTLDGTPIAAATASAFLDVAPDHATALQVFRATDAGAITAALGDADGLVLLPTPDVAATAPGPLIAAYTRWALDAGTRHVLVVEPVAPLGEDFEARQAEVRAGTELLVREIATVAEGVALVPLGSALASLALFGVLDAEGRPSTEAGAWLASCLIVGTATGRLPEPTATVVDAGADGVCRALAIDAALPPAEAWRPWLEAWDDGVDLGGTRWIGDTWTSPLVHLDGSVEAVARDVWIARGRGDVRGRLDVVGASLVIGGTLGVGGFPGADGGRGVLRVAGGSYLQAAVIEVGGGEVWLEAGEVRAGTIVAPDGLGAVRWSPAPCDARLGAQRVVGDVELRGCFELPREAGVEGGVTLAAGGVLYLDARGGIVLDGPLEALGEVRVSGPAPDGPVALVTATAIRWSPATVVLPPDRRLRVEDTELGGVLWLEPPAADAPEGPFAPPLLPPGGRRSCGCAPNDPVRSPWALPPTALLLFLRRRRVG